MLVDLSALAGLGLLFDPDTLEIKPQAGYEFNRSVRHFAEVAAVFSERDALPPEFVVFYLEHLAVCPAQEEEILVKYSLAYGFTILPPLRIGREFNKTHGHSHPVVGGYNFSFPEIYAQLSGRMWLLLQKHHADNLAELEDCVLIKMKPGDVVLIPPNYAHMQINPSDKHPSVTAGLYSSRMKPEFDFYKQKQGFAYRLNASGDSYEAESNPNYPSAPSLRTLEMPAGTPFAWRESSRPVWFSLNQHPETYAFLSDPGATAREFTHFDAVEGPQKL